MSCRVFFQVTALRFSKDMRIREVRNLLQSSKPVRVSLVQRPEVRYEQVARKFYPTLLISMHHNSYDRKLFISNAWLFQVFQEVFISEVTRRENSCHLHYGSYFTSSIQWHLELYKRSVQIFRCILGKPIPIFAISTIYDFIRMVSLESL